MQVSLKSVVKILSKINNNVFNTIFNNPQNFCEKVSNKINETKALLLTVGLEHNKTDELNKSSKRIYNIIMLNSNIEKEFLQHYKKHKQIKLFIKLTN
ncbi:hypothetical protein [Campylobacter canadensis]|uniref:Uncharacterized protein n=1 Tax=Campylobacter canadensis TaxID=449520 RepID=A0ABS7WUD3_9BACT|nr:hypothetical protein [Campylobacter canadensis]MBZ7987634.1 hypothetical protein [Campylobacter canadensis]MBZ7994933.1 hypothetical protein [Campylobacter canadensis]MBZ7996920.1 hypothetical protein [Campylobacter canadensis]MBZ7998720.1 hypothetical protein [Campylobacter canadensis]MBZ8000399.1 hypothetical protein [Campylobacter canadensis]